MSRSQAAVSSGDRKLRAPRRHGEILAVPPLDEAAELAALNAERLSASSIRIGPRSLAEFRRWTRQVCLERARGWTADLLGTLIECPSDAPLFLTGHQPQLAHAGVWVKNIAVSRLANRTGGVGLNLIVDNDTVSSQTVLVPAGTFEQPRLEGVPFDAPRPQQPWEELAIQDRALFNTFAERVGRALVPWGIDPILNEMWPDAIETARKNSATAACLSACRMRQERRWELGNLELPVSEMCRTKPFLEFAAHVLVEAERFHASYNAAVHDYRRANHVRNHRHPVPDLERDGERVEVPFWFWRPGERIRRRVFVSRMENAGIAVDAEGERLFVEPHAERVADALGRLKNDGRFRTRALTTTLFARLCLGDLFVHGIGGAKYDEITDRLIGDFFQCPIPGYLTLTASLHLPLGSNPVTEDDVRRLKGRLRALQFNADRLLGPDRSGSLAAERQALIAETLTGRSDGLSRRERNSRRAENRNRHLRFKSLREQLAGLAAAEIEETRRQLDLTVQQVRANGVLLSREFPAVLFPRPFLDEFRESVLSGRQACSGKKRG